MITAARTLLADVESAIANLGTDVTQSTLDDLAVVRAAMQWSTFDDDEWSLFLLGMLDDIV